MYTSLSPDTGNPYLIMQSTMLHTDGDISRAKCGAVKPPSPMTHQQWQFVRKHCRNEKKVICVKQQTGKH